MSIVAMVCSLLPRRQRDGRRGNPYSRPKSGCNPSTIAEETIELVRDAGGKPFYGDTPYAMHPTLTNPGVAPWNGAIESAHCHLKAAVRDALLIRARADFADLGIYRTFIDELIARRNARIAKRIDSEHPFLQVLL